MDKEQMAAKWETIKAKAMKHWAELTEEDFVLADGSVERLYTMIQHRFGETRSQIQSKMDRMRTA